MLLLLLFLLSFSSYFSSSSDFLMCHDFNLIYREGPWASCAHTMLSMACHRVRTTGCSTTPFAPHGASRVCCCCCCYPVSLNLVPLVLLLRPLLCWSFPVLAFMAGYVTSDSGAVEDILINHHYVSNQSLAVADALRAGCDVISGSWKDVSSLRHFFFFLYLFNFSILYFSIMALTLRTMHGQRAAGTSTTLLTRLHQV